jgi:hypothetical protein
MSHITDTPGCPVCGSEATRPWERVSGYAYGECASCDSIFIDPGVLREIDGGFGIIEYSESYWQNELRSAWERSYGASLARVAETILYARRPIRRFVDIGSGPGFLLDALSTYLPDSAERFFGVELFPPLAHTAHTNYLVGDVASLTGTFDGGCCIEVFEHLTPRMVSALLGQLAEKSEPDALYVINTGLPAFVNLEDRGYIDHTGRGHIVSYGLRGVALLASRFGFRVHPLPGKTWAFCLEFRPTSPVGELIQDRIWTPVPENKALLHDSRMGNLLYILAIDTARAYC